MHPILFKIGPLTIYTYGVFLATGFFVAILIAARHAKKEGIPSGKILDLCFWVILSAIVGSRLLFVVMNIDHYLKNPIEIFSIWEGGLVFYGGVLFAVPTAMWYIKRNAFDFWKTADLLSTPIAIGHAIGRCGCFFAGCCYGKPAPGLPWAVTFFNEECFAPRGIPLHPTQLYESVGVLFIFLTLIALRKYKSFNGQLLLTYMLFYSVLRFIVEFFRGDERVFIAHISLSQGISVFVFLAAIIGIIILGRKGKIRLQTKRPFTC